MWESRWIKYTCETRAREEEEEEEEEEGGGAISQWGVTGGDGQHDIMHTVFVCARVCVCVPVFQYI